MELKANDTLPAGTLVVLQFNIGEKVSPMHIDKVVLAVKGGAPIPGRAAVRASPMLSLIASAGSLAWKIASPLAGSAELSVRDLRGREIGRFGLLAGASSGLIPAKLPPGRLTAELEFSQPPISLLGWKRVKAPNPRYKAIKVAFSCHNG